MGRTVVGEFENLSAYVRGHPERSRFSGGAKDLLLAVPMGDPSRG